MLYESILKLRDQVSLIITSKRSNGNDIADKDIEKLAELLEIDFIGCETINEQVIQRVNLMNSDIGICINWQPGRIEKLANSFKYGILIACFGGQFISNQNAYPFREVLDGLDKVVLTLYLITRKGNNSGSIIKHHLKIDENAYVSAIYDYFEKVVPVMFEQAISGVCNDSINPQPADYKDSADLEMEKKKDLKIDWNNSSIGISRLIRSSMSPKSAYTVFNGKKLIIHKARHENTLNGHQGSTGQILELRDNGEVAVVASDGLIILEEVQLESTRTKWPRGIIDTSNIKLGDREYRFEAQVTAQSGDLLEY